MFEKLINRLKALNPFERQRKEDIRQLRLMAMHINQAILESLFRDWPENHWLVVKAWYVPTSLTGEHVLKKMEDYLASVDINSSEHIVQYCNLFAFRRAQNDIISPKQMAKYIIKNSTPTSLLPTEHVITRWWFIPVSK